MLEEVLSVSYSDIFEINVEYGIDIEKYLKYETTQVYKVKHHKCVEPNLLHSRQQMPRGFAVLYYKVNSVFFDDYSSVMYELYFGDNAQGNTILSSKEAMSLIEKYNLTIVHNNSDGKVWE